MPYVYTGRISVDTCYCDRRARISLGRRVGKGTGCAGCRRAHIQIKNGLMCRTNAHTHTYTQEIPSRRPDVRVARRAPLSTHGRRYLVYSARDHGISTKRGPAPCNSANGFPFAFATKVNVAKLVFVAISGVFRNSWCSVSFSERTGWCTLYDALYTLKPY